MKRPLTIGDRVRLVRGLYHLRHRSMSLAGRTGTVEALFSRTIHVRLDQPDAEGPKSVLAGRDDLRRIDDEATA